MSRELTLITGASSDIGMTLVRHLLTTTDRTIVAHAFRASDRIGELEREFGGRILPVYADLSDLAAVRALGDAVSSLGELSAVVHLPGLKLVHDRFTKFNWDHFEADLSIQVRSVAILLQRFLPNMGKLPGARVVFLLSSVVHGVPPKFMSMYTLVKYAQLGLMRSLAAEYAGTKVRINAISPSMVETRFLSEISEHAVQMSANANPAGRNATPGDLLGVFDLLLSAASDYLAGVDIPVTAGTAV